MNADAIYAELRKIAPSINFAASAEPDADFEWDGDGQDPSDYGMDPVTVTITATAIVAGELIEGNAYLGGHYVDPYEGLGEVSGYLPQMLQEAATKLAEQIPDGYQSRHECGIALAFLDAEMARSYAEQRVEIEASRS